MKSAIWSLIAAHLVWGCGSASLSRAYLTDRETGCKIADPFIYTNGENRQAQWSGRCRDGIAEGRGVITFYNENGIQTALLRTCIDSANYTCSRGGNLPSG